MAWGWKPGDYLIEARWPPEPVWMFMENLRILRYYFKYGNDGFLLHPVVQSGDDM
jgi:hypothetical protein